MYIILANVKTIQRSRLCPFKAILAVFYGQGPDFMGSKAYGELLRDSVAGPVYAQAMSLSRVTAYNGTRAIAGRRLS